MMAEEIGVSATAAKRGWQLRHSERTQTVCLRCVMLCCRWQDLTTTLDGPEVSIFKEACRKNKVYGIFSIT
jgi:hypothetical protein